ncbi:MAG: hypothetical protein R6V85_15630 [Polyangia bacterium]
MTAAPPIDRRDPCSPLLLLGEALGRARLERSSGWIDVQDRDRVHRIRVVGGAITQVRPAWGDGLRPADGALRQHAARLFSLPRPYPVWRPEARCAAASGSIDPAAVVLAGVSSRSELFDPRILVERIPVETLVVPRETLSSARRFLPLSRADVAFLASLERPTPIPMILWKRGLDPRRAGALLISLNLLGLWRDEWEIGLLPRLSAAVRVLRARRRGASDAELLGVSSGDPPGATDRAFRRLSLELHPDRAARLPDRERAIAAEAFRCVSAAYHRQRRSRRSRPVRDHKASPVARVTLDRRPAPDRWPELLAQARRLAALGEPLRARTFALKALALSPPEDARLELSEIVSTAA